MSSQTRVVLWALSRRNICSCNTPPGTISVGNSANSVNLQFRNNMHLVNALRVMRMSKPIQFRIKSKGDNATMNIVYVYEVGLEGFDALVALVFMRRSRRRRRPQVRLI